MSTKKKKRIRKTSQITVLNDGVIVNSMESNSVKDAPSINAVNRSFLNKNTGGTISGNLVLTNNKTIKGNTLAGRSLTILCVYSDNNVLVGSPELSMKIRSATVPIWENGSEKKKLLVEGDAALGDTLPVGSGFLYTGEEPIPDNYEVTTPPFSNPNQLINGDFQVWQRGTIFNNVQNGVFCTDRWRIYNGGNNNLKIEKVDNGLKMSGNEGGASIYQPMEDSFYTLNAGKSYTFSYSFDGVVYKKHGIIPETRDNNLISIYRSVPTIFNWAKLELGEIATPFVPKSYVEELVKCQYYYEYIDNMLFIVAGDKTYEHYQYYSCTTDFKVKKRINPSFKCGKVTENASGKVISLTNAFSNQNRITSIQLTNISTDLGVLISDVEIDAEIY